MVRGRWRSLPIEGNATGQSAFGSVLFHRLPQRPAATTATRAAAEVGATGTAASASTAAAVGEAAARVSIAPTPAIHRERKGGTEAKAYASSASSALASFRSAKSNPSVNQS